MKDLKPVGSVWSIWSLMLRIFITYLCYKEKNCQFSANYKVQGWTWKRSFCEWKNISCMTVFSINFISPRVGVKYLDYESISGSSIVIHTVKEKVVFSKVKRPRNLLRVVYLIACFLLVEVEGNVRSCALAISRLKWRTENVEAPVLSRMGQLVI